MLSYFLETWRTLMPLIMVVIMVRFFGANRSWREGLSITPFAIFASIAFSVPYMLASVLLRPEFPSMIGAMVGLAIVVPAARKGFLIPKDTWDFPESTSWPDSWIGKLELKLDDVTGKAPNSTLMGWVPYVLLAVILVASRTIEPFKNALTSFALGWSNILGETGISGAIQPLYLPGGILLMVVLLTALHLMLSDFQFNVAQQLGLSTALMVSLQAVVAAAGNMIAIHNVVAASATVGLLGREGETIRKTILPTIYYLIAAEIIGLIAFYVLGIGDTLLHLG